MAKTLVSPKELLSILTKRLQNDVDCTGCSVGEPEKHGTETVNCNWRAGIRGDATVTAFGKRKVSKIIEEVQAEYNLE